MAKYATFTRSTAAAGRDRIDVTGRSVGVIAGPIDANIRIQLGGATADSLPVSRGGAVGFSEPFTVLVVTWDASVSGADFSLVISPDQNGAGDLVKASYTTVAAADGDLVSIGAATSPKVTDPNADGTLIAFTKGILAQLQSANSPAGIPDIAAVACAVAGTTYDHGVAAVLGRNARWLTVRSDPTNSGEVQFAVSAGAGFSGFFPLEPGDAYNIEGGDVATVRVKSSGAGDVVRLEAH